MSNVLPLIGQVLRKVVEWTDSASDEHGHRDVDPENREDSHVITSLIEDTADPNNCGGINGWHKVVLDIDMPCKVIESSTPGHFHLYIDCPPIQFTQYYNLMCAMRDAGILEPGYVSASRFRGYSSVRLPWINKFINLGPHL